MDKIIVAVGSQNQAKNEAVRSVFTQAFQGNHIELISVDAPSGVDAMPMNDEVAIAGAKNRALGAMHDVNHAAYGVGLEGNVADIAGRLMLHGWVVIVSSHGAEGIGHSGGLEIPKHIAARLRNGEELGPLIQQLTADEEDTIRHSQGTNGLLTGGLYTRVDEFTHATQNALAPFIKPDLYI